MPTGPGIRRLYKRHQALAAKQYDVAASHFQVAIQIQHTDEAANGLRRARDAAAAEKKAADPHRADVAHNPAPPAVRNSGVPPVVPPVVKNPPVEPVVPVVPKKVEPATPTAADAAYTQAYRAGQAALAAKKFDEAIPHFDEALRHKPNDSAAQAMKRQAEKEKADAVGAQLHQQQYQAAMSRAHTALAAKQYTQAEAAYGEALKLVPNDPAANKGLADAKAAQAHAATTPTPPTTGTGPAHPATTPTPTTPGPDQAKAKYAASMKAGTEAYWRESSMRRFSTSRRRSTPSRTIKPRRLIWPRRKR